MPIHHSLNKQAELIINYKDNLQEFLKRTFKHTEDENQKIANTIGLAIQDFVKDEVMVEEAYNHEQLVRDQGHPHVVFVGKWKTHPETDLLIRASNQGITLARHNIGWDWFYDWRPDLKDRGKFYGHMNPASIEAYQQRAQHALVFRQSLDGYLAIMQSRSITLGFDPDK